MIKNLVFKAQSLDNSSPDHYQIGDETLTIEDASRRREITNQISDVALNGKFILKSDGAELIIYRSCFLVQVYSMQLDQAGRRAPILCSGHLNGDRNLQFESQNIVDQIEKFCRGINRSIYPEHARAVADAITTLKKKEARLGWVGIGIAAGLIILVAVSIHITMLKR